MSGIVYLATNTKIKKVKQYVGITEGKLSSRIHKHKRYAFKYNSPTIFHKAIRKHGLESFTWEIIDHYQTTNEGNDKEKLYIKKYNSYNKGYNMTEGGTLVIGEKIRKKMSNAKKKHWKDPNYRNKRIRETKELWQSESYRHKMDKIHNSKSFREKVTNIAKSSWADPDIRAKRIEGLKKSWAKRKSYHISQ